MKYNHDPLRYRHQSDGFTIVELILALTIFGFLLSIAINSSQRLIYKEKEKSFANQISSYLMLLKRETRRWGGTCSLSPKLEFEKDIMSSNEMETAFEASCIGMNNEEKFNIQGAGPSISKTTFFEISDDINVTTKGMISSPKSSKANDAIVIVIGSRHNSFSNNQKPTCLVLETPFGLITRGIYQDPYLYSSSRAISNYNPLLNPKKCI